MTRSGPEAAGRRDRVGDGARLGDDLELRPAVEQRDESLADDLVVVDDQQAQGTGPVGSPSRSSALLDRSWAWGRGR